MKKFDGHKNIFVSYNKEHHEDNTSIDNLLEKKNDYSNTKDYHFKGIEIIQIIEMKFIQPQNKLIMNQVKT